jgi:hypothetical protein
MNPKTHTATRIEDGVGQKDCGGSAQRRHPFSTAGSASKSAWRFASRRNPQSSRSAPSSRRGWLAKPRSSFSKKFSQLFAEISSVSGWKQPPEPPLLGGRECENRTTETEK